jgi:cytochrome c oxidase subunit 4
MRLLFIRRLALSLLLALKIGLAYLPLGRANMAAALIIAFAMAAVVALTCMRLATAPRLAAIFAFAGICWFAVLLTLGGIDYQTRTIFPVGGRDARSERS